MSFPVPFPVCRLALPIFILTSNRLLRHHYTYGHCSAPQCLQAASLSQHHFAGALVLCSCVHLQTDFPLPLAHRTHKVKYPPKYMDRGRDDQRVSGIAYKFDIMGQPGVKVRKTVAIIFSANVLRSLLFSGFPVCLSTSHSQCD